MVVNGRPLKRAKRRVTADLCYFLTFPSADLAAELDGPFRSNVRAFLALLRRLPSPPVIPAPPSPESGEQPRLMAWRVAFRVGGGAERGGDEKEGPQLPAVETVELDVVEEDVLRSKSVYCDQCRVVGWSGHPVCGKRYHFIIRNDMHPLSAFHQTCIRCGTLMSMADLRCISCNYEMTGHDFENWASLLLENTTHLLHGVVHANGYGHLLRVNGREGGSKYLTGYDIMGFWDRLCKMLRVRKVSVMDISKKYGMEYRLLHAVTAGHPWYGNWEYKFGAGSFALTAEAYRKAVDTLSGVPLSIFFSHARGSRTPLQNTIALYCSLSIHPLVTVRDLFLFVRRLLHEHAKTKSPCKSKLLESPSGVLCEWSINTVETAEEVILKVLQAVGVSKWVSWRALRGATCHAIKPLELLNYCLSGLGGKATGDGKYVIVRHNAEAQAIEYRLEAATVPTDKQIVTHHHNLPRPPANQLLSDLKFLYDALLNPGTMHHYKPKVTRDVALDSATKLIDCKQFIRHYGELGANLMPSNPFVIGIWCHVELADYPNDYTAPPPEILVLPLTATVADLKLQVAKAFQETYLIFRTFQPEQLLYCGDAKDATLVSHLFGSTGCVARIRGRCIGVDYNLGQFRKERGLENWIVDCSCGARDDDGERMMACDSCGVWQHTRCAGVDDFDDVPAKFICKKCLSLTKYKKAAGGRLKSVSSNRRCKDEIRSSLATAGRESFVSI